MATTFEDVNRGPIKLQHDVTPRDFSQLKPNFKDIMMEENHRYKGFPANSMFSPREPIRAGNIDDEDLRLFKKTTHFDADRPTLDEGHYGVRYGENVPVDSGTPKPIAGALHPERSSAEHRKFRKHQFEAEDDLQKFKMEKMQRLVAQSQEKKKDMEMLMNYYPWGRPGGGAPKDPDNRKQKFTEEEVKDSFSPRQSEKAFHDNFGRPGAGAPLRTDSGHIRTEIAGDPNIRFHQAENNHIVRGAIGENMRYVTRQDKGRQYADDLDQQIVDRALSEQEKRLQELRAEYEMMKHHPYGKPGAGAPNYSQSGNTMLTRHRAYLTKDFLEARRLEKQDDQRRTTKSDENVNLYDPWGKGYGAPVRDDEGRVVNSKWSDGKNGVLEYDDPKTVGARLNNLGEGEGAGAPLRSESGHHLKTGRLITLKADERGEKTVKDNMSSQSDPQNNWFPFGTAGGGAPNKDKDGNVITHIYAKETLERDSADQRRKTRNAREYLNELEQERDMQAQKKMEEKRYRRAPIGEFARIMKDGQVGKPRRDPYTGELLNQSLPMTDVTKLRTGYVSQKNEYTKDYHTELQRAAEERHRIRRMDGYKDKQQSRQHYEVFGDFFGRPGGGAPNPVGSRRHDTDEVVYSPRKEKNDYVKSFESPRVSRDDENGLPSNYIRNTVNSTHGNQYEYYVPKEPLSKNYRVEQPYATH